MTQRGFTLLEVLIAIALFSLLGLASYQLLQRVLHSEQRIEQHEQQLRSLQRALVRGNEITIGGKVRKLWDRPGWDGTNWDGRFNQVWDGAM